MLQDQEGRYFKVPPFEVYRVNIFSILMLCMSLAKIKDFLYTAFFKPHLSLNIPVYPDV